MAQTYHIEFKEGACKRVQSGIPAAQAARKLGINVNPCTRRKGHIISPI